MNFKGLGPPIPLTLLVVSHMATHFSWLGSFPWQVFHILGISNFPLYYLFGFTVAASFIALSGAPCKDSVTHGLGFQAFLWNQGRSLLDTNFFHSGGLQNQHQMLQSGTTASCTWTLLNHRCRSLSSLMSEYKKWISRMNSQSVPMAASILELSSTMKVFESTSHFYSF
jgi:hypothetical protein